MQNALTVVTNAIALPSPNCFKVCMHLAKSGPQCTLEISPLLGEI
jgi:hypothetical protein